MIEVDMTIQISDLGGGWVCVQIPGLHHVASFRSDVHAANLGQYIFDNLKRGSDD